MNWSAHDTEYEAKGWPIINPMRSDYCYQPCRFGLHVCGHHPDGINALTIAFATSNIARAVAAFFTVKFSELAEAAGEDGDFVVDLQIDHDCSEDFMMNRQMMDRLRALHAGYRT